MPDETITPDKIKVERQEGTDHVRITFGEADTATKLILDQEALLWLVSALHGKIARSPMTPISLDRLRPGKMIALRGFSASRQADGSLQLVTMVEFEDRVVTIPFLLSPEMVKDLREEIGGSG